MDEPDVQHLRLSPSMEAIVREDSGRSRMVLTIVMIAAGLVAIGGLAYLIREAVDGAPAPEPTYSSLAGAAALMLCGGAIALWARLTLRRELEMAQGADAGGARPIVRATGQIVLLSVPRNRLQELRMVTPADDEFGIDGNVHSVLVKSAIASDENVSPTEPSALSTVPQTNVWLIDEATILYHPALGLVFEVLGADGSVLYRDQRYRPGA